MRASRAMGWVAVVVAGAGLVSGCGQSGKGGDARAGAASSGAGEDVAPQPGTLAYDKGLWQELLREHTKIRRVVRHTETTVEAVTESDDPDVRAKIVEHAKAMQARVRTGSQVRIWDPVFAEMFQKHAKMKIELTETEKGVRVVETSDDPEALALLRSHAMGVSEFVRRGLDVSGEETRRFKAGDPLPAPEVAIGGVAHRFLLSQPGKEQIAALKDEGVVMVVNFRKESEHPEFDERGAAEGAGAGYCNVPFQGAAGLTDEVMASARAAMKEADEKGNVAALHCRTGNRVGAVWAAYRALDKGVPVEQALAEARAMTTSPELLARASAYIAQQKK